MIEETLEDLANEFGLSPESLLRLVSTLAVDADGKLQADQDLISRVRSILSTIRPLEACQDVYHEPKKEPGFSSISIEKWRQFDSVEIDLSKRLTVLTGENGTGKTTLLSLLGNSLDWHTNFVGTPSSRQKKSGFDYRSFKIRKAKYIDDDRIGSIYFDSGSKSILEITSWSDESAEFGISTEPFTEVPGMYISSQRYIPTYTEISRMPTRFQSSAEIIENYRTRLRNFGHSSNEEDPFALIKESLISAAIYSEGNSYVTVDPEAKRIWEGFQLVLSKLLPDTLGFDGLHVDRGEVIVRTRAGSFALEASSGGISSVFNIAWQIYMMSIEQENFTVCFDEPENHLHPELQRSILPGLLTAFPKIKFVVATHSPFVATSVRRAALYALRRDISGRVYSEKLDLNETALSAEVALNEILGVNSTIPIWAEDKISEVVSRFDGTKLTRASVRAMLDELRDLGVKSSSPEMSDFLFSRLNKGDQ